jgi:hypothetical protein
MHILEPDQSASEREIRIGDHSKVLQRRDLLGGFGDAAAVQTIALGHAIFSTSAIQNNYLFVAGVGALTFHPVTDCVMA